MSLGPETFDAGDIILVVDDEMFSRNLLGFTLKNIGEPQVICVESVAAAEDTLRDLAKPPRLTILDYQMPDRSGLDLLQAIRAGRTGRFGRDLPIMMLSGIDDGAVVAAAVALDVDAFVTKPLMAEGLRARLPFLLGSDRPIKSPEAYEAVMLRSLSVPHATDGAVSGGTPVSISELKPLQRLTRDIRAPRGDLIAAAGSTVTGRLIALLRDLSEAGLALSPIHVKALA